MWLITSRGFLSVVGDRNDTERVLIRARSGADLLEMVEFAASRGIPGLEVSAIFEDRTADYRYRLFAPRESFAALAAALVGAIDYPNFKNEVGRADPDRALLYGKVWEVLHRIQTGAD